jgi:hypothetical protein
MGGHRTPHLPMPVTAQRDAIVGLGLRSSRVSPTGPRVALTGSPLHVHGVAMGTELPYVEPGILRRLT